MLKLSLQIKITIIAVIVLIIGFSSFVIYVIKQDEISLLREKERASDMMAQPILYALYKDMLDERADMIYYMMQGVKDTKGVERVQIVRINGREAAFGDNKTLESVEKEYGKLKPEWKTPRIFPGGENIAEGVDYPEFKEAFQFFKNNPKNTKAFHYIEESKGKRLCTLLIPIEERQKCSACHKKGEGRGFLMISTSLEDSYKELAMRRNRWILIGFGIIGFLSIVLTQSIRMGVTKNVEKLSEAAHMIARGDLTHRVAINSKDEIGMLAETMNDMASKLENAYANLENQVRERTRELQEANKMLVESNIKIKESDRLKSEFMATMSHELRTPLNSIIGFSELLLGGTYGELNNTQRERTVNIHKNGIHLMEIINDILDLSKIEAGWMELGKEAIDVRGIIDSIISMGTPLIKGKDIQLTVRIDDRLPRIMADPKRLKQIIFNLLSNAAKFTEKGEIKIQAEQANRNNIFISVSDTGIGIKKEDISKVFEAFRQIDMSSTRDKGGTGLGLAITKKLVEMHGGTIWFTSTFGKGTTFFVKLPV